MFFGANGQYHTSRIDVFLLSGEGRSNRVGMVMIIVLSFFWGREGVKKNEINLSFAIRP